MQLGLFSAYSALRPAFTVGVNRQLGAVIQLAFHQQVADMRLYSFDADVQLFADVFIGLAFGNKEQNLLLTFG
ncbi:hypothetical protein D3C81_2204110 [compost metagenome]